MEHIDTVAIAIIAVFAFPVAMLIIGTWAEVMSWLTTGGEDD